MHNQTGKRSFVSIFYFPQGISIRSLLADNAWYLGMRLLQRTILFITLSYFDIEFLRFTALKYNYLPKDSLTGK